MPYFQYKYVVLHGKGEVKKWEEGLNRIAHVSRVQKRGKSGIPVISDIFSSFAVNFEVFNPFAYDERDGV